MSTAKTAGLRHARGPRDDRGGAQERPHGANRLPAPSEPAFQEVAEFVRAGKAGKIVQVDTQIHYRAGTPDPTPQDPPATLDWDLWCGPGPKIPYSPAVGHRSWRLEKTSGHGHLVDWGIHNIDSVRMMLGLATPQADHRGRRTVPLCRQNHHARTR
jgi:predicted dehydrogenase